jgi:hypothetical protein
MNANQYLASTAGISGTFAVSEWPTVESMFDDLYAIEGNMRVRPAFNDEEWTGRMKFKRRRHTPTNSQLYSVTSCLITNPAWDGLRTEESAMSHAYSQAVNDFDELASVDALLRQLSP